MLGARKAMDLRRDPRFALHSGSDDPPEPNDADVSAVARAWAGDAKVAGRMIEILDESLVLEMIGAAPGPSHLFRADVGEIVLVRLNAAGDKLVISSWHEGRGLVTLER